jgi:glycosyltransferase involved in cell wall biosynthesis
LYPVGSIASLKHAMELALEGIVQAKQMGANAKQIAESRYSVDAMRIGYLQLYQSLSGD